MSALIEIETMGRQDRCAFCDAPLTDHEKNTLRIPTAPNARVCCEHYSLEKSKPRGGVPARSHKCANTLSFAGNADLYTERVTYP